MILPKGWKSWLVGLIGAGALVYLFSGADSGTYRAPQFNQVQEEPIGDFNRAKYAEILASMKVSRLVTKIEKGLSDHEIRLHTGPRWQALGEAVRRQEARALWDVWAKLHPPGQRYKTRIVIVDDKGAKIGGSRLLDPSKIWIRKK